MTIEEGNRLILDYMNSDEDVNTCSYYDSMDALMPVVYKMCNNGHEINITICKLKTTCYFTKEEKMVAYSELNLVNDVWKCIVEILST